jgi:hypothetical protein
MLSFRKTALPITLSALIQVFVVCASWALMCSLSAGPRPWWWGLSFAFLPVVFLWGLESRRDQAFAARATRPIGPSWTVALNNVPVGTLSDVEYATMIQSVRRDPQLAWRDSDRLIRLLVSRLERLIIGIPIGFFFVLLLTAFFVTPHQYESVVHAIDQRPAALLPLVRLAVRLVFILVGMFEMVSFLLHANGDPSAYSDALHRQLRTRFALMADGIITLQWGSADTPPANEWLYPAFPAPSSGR